MLKKTAMTMALLAAMAGSVAAQATTNDQYGDLLAGSFTPAASFATLSYSNTGNVYYFTLTANDLNSLFTNKAFIGSIAVDSPASVTISDVSGGAPVSLNPGGGPGGGFDYRFVLFQGQNRLTAGESVSWTAMAWSSAGTDINDSVFWGRYSSRLYRFTHTRSFA